MACRDDGEGRVLELRLAPLGHGYSDVGIVLSPDEFDRYIQRFKRSEMLGVSGMFGEKFRRQLHEGWAGTMTVRSGRQLE